MTRRRCLAAWMLLLWAWTGPAQAIDRAAPLHQTSRLWRLAALEQATLEQRGVVLHDVPLSSYLQAVAERLWEQVDTDLSPPTFKVIVDTRMEAYAYPNGYCFLTTGILSQIENEDQLAMILAHEMVHYSRQHTAQLYDHFQKSAPETGLPYADQSQVASGQAIEQKIDAAESQADKEGLSLLKGAGYCQAEVLTLMSNLLNSMQGQGPPETVGRLEHRILSIKELLGQAHRRSSCTSATGGDPEIFLNRIAPALMANAQASLQRGDWNQADRCVSKFLVLKPDNAKAYYLKGEILRRRSDGDGKNQCIGYYETALKIDPKFPLAYRALGELHFKAGRYQTAKHYFEAFLSLAPRDDAREYIKGYLRQCQD
jgi:predicted Zn-dependent protease